MKTKKIVLALICMLIILRSADSAIAEIKTFVKEYTYQASEVDSKLSCRTIALEQIKRMLLEELGTYLESETEVKNFQLTRDQTTTLAAGIVLTEIVSEYWDGKVYRLRARIKADPNQVAEAISRLCKDRQKRKELEESRARAVKYFQEIERLKREIAAV